MKSKYPVWLFVAAVVLLPIFAFAIVSWYETNHKELLVFGGKEHRIANFEMKNQEGKIFSSKDWQGKIVVVDFFFTHCPTICPKMTKNLKLVAESFINDDKVQINSFTVDPERDSVERLLKYAAQFDIKNRNWHLLTGEKTAIYKLARKSFIIVATDGDGGANDFIHSDKLVLIDKEKRIRGYYDGTNKTEVEQLIKDIKRLQ